MLGIKMLFSRIPCFCKDSSIRSDLAKENGVSVSASLSKINIPTISKLRSVLTTSDTFSESSAGASVKILI